MSLKVIKCKYPDRIGEKSCVVGVDVLICKKECPEPCEGYKEYNAKKDKI